MARKIRLLISNGLLSLGLLGVSSSFAQDAPAAPSLPPSQPSPTATATPAVPTPPPAPSPCPPVQPKKSKEGSSPFSPGPKPLEQNAFLQTLTPEQQQKFRQNLELWKLLPPEKQAELRKTEENRLRAVLKEVNRAIEQSHLKLTQEQRQLFTDKFAKERRSIEEQLRKEMDEKRQQSVNQLISNLASEFAPPAPSPQANSTPTYTPAPVQTPAPAAAQAQPAATANPVAQ